MRSINLIALAVPFFFVLIAAEVLIARAQGLRAYRFNDAVTDMSCGIGQQVVAVFLKVALLGAYAIVYEYFRVFDLAPWPVIAWTVAILGVDIAYYWWHRLSHEVAFMWAVHVVHHQSEDYNLAVALRQAWFSGLTSFPFHIPLALIGVPPLVFAVSSAMNTLYQFWIHTRIVGKLGPVELVMNTPSHHRVHHGRDDKYLDRNYAGILIVWDRVFGSFQKEEEEPKYGIIARYESWNPIYANVYFWQELMAKAKCTPRLIDKLRVFYKSPGWAPPGALAPGCPDATSEPFVRVVTEVPRGVTSFVLAQFVFAVGASVILMTVGAAGIGTSVASSTSPGVGATTAGLPVWISIALAIWILAGTLAWGGLFERKSWAVPVEVARSLAAAAAVIAALSFGAISPWLAVVGVMALVGVAVWSLLLPRLTSLATAPSLS